MTDKNISRNNTHRQYAMEYGTFIGIAWGCAFLAYVEGVASDNALLVLAGGALCLVGAVIPFLFGARLNRKMAAVDERMSYLPALLFSFSMLMYACLMDGLIMYAWFEFADSGRLFDALDRMMKTPELADIYRQSGMGEQYEQAKVMLKELGMLPAWEKALSMINNNFFLSLLLSFAVAKVVSLKRGTSK